MNASVNPNQLHLAAEVPAADTAIEGALAVPRQSEDQTTNDPIRLLPPQDELTAYIRDDGALIIEQQCWPNENQVVRVAGELIPHFIDRLTDLLGIGSAGRL